MSLRTVPRLLLGALLAAAPVAARAPFPLVAGEAVVTCNPIDANSPFVLGLVDVRNPECDPLAVKGDNWPAPMYHNEQPNPTRNAADEWTDVNLGLVFGLTLDDADPPHIYVSSTSLFTGTGASKVFRLHGVTGAIRTLATLPTSNPTAGPSLGDLAFDPVWKQLFVTNLEDGMIYRLDLNGTVLDTFDPFLPDDGSAGFAALGERLWAIQVHGGRVYFARWAGNPTVGPNEIWSAGIDATGAIDPRDVTRELIMPPLQPSGNTSNPVADIAFADDDWMLLSERSMSGNKTSAHASRVLEFSGGHLGWTPSTHEFRIGGIGSGTNSAGGIDYDCTFVSSCNAGRRVWASGDALRLDSLSIYGIQGTLDTGGTNLDSYLVDLDGNTSQQQKTGLGDVEIYRPVCTIDAVAGPDAASCGPPPPLTLDGSLSLVSRCLSPEYRWLRGTQIERDWATDPRVTVSPTTTTTYRLEVRCGRCPCFGADALTVVVGASAAPGTIGNTLLGVKSGLNVVFSWRPVPGATSFSIYRGTVKGAYPPAPQRAGLSSPTDTLPDVPPAPEAKYFYRVVGVSCGNVEGP